MKIDKSSELRPGRHILGLLAFPVVGIAIGIIWLWFTLQVLGVGKTGFGNVAALVVMPVWAIGFGVLIWLPWWLIHDRKFGVMSTGRALLSGASGGFILSYVLMGPGGFTTKGGAVVLAYAVIAICSIGGWAHNAVLRRGAG